MAMEAWKHLPSRGAPANSMINIKQKGDESYETFLARLTDMTKLFLMNKRLK